MTQPSPYSNPQAWDIIQLNGMPWGGPNGFGGGIEIDGATRFFKVQQSDGQGLDGATQIYRGIKPKPFKLIFTWGFTTQTGITPDAQDAYWVLFTLLIVNYRASKVGMPPPVYDVYHPSLATLGIGAILIEEVGAQKVDKETKLSKAVMVVREFCPPPPVPATVTPVGATGDTNVDYSPAAPTDSALNIALQAKINQQLAIGAGGIPGALP